MIEVLLALPAQIRARLRDALEAGTLEAPFSVGILKSELGSGGGYDSAAVVASLTALDARGIGGPAVALALDVAARTAAAVIKPDLVWSGPSAPGIHTRATRQVYEELVSAANSEIWISTFAYWEGQKAFKSLAARMDAVPELRVRLLLNIPRRHDDERPAAQLVNTFAERLWKHDWPGERRPEVYYDPRSLILGEDGRRGGVLHAKALVVDELAAFITSANLTEAAFDDNIEVGIISRDQLVAISLARHFRQLIDHQMLVPLG